MWACLSHTKGKFQDSNPDFRFDLPILAQGLPAVFLEGLPAVLLADWRGVFGKNGCWRRNANQLLSMTPMEPQGQSRGTT